FQSRREVVADIQIHLRNNGKRAGIPGADVGGQGQQAAVINPRRHGWNQRGIRGCYDLLPENSDWLIRVSKCYLGSAINFPPAPTPLAGNANLSTKKVVGGGKLIGQCANNVVRSTDRLIRIAEVLGNLQLLAQVQITKTD